MNKAQILTSALIGATLVGSLGLALPAFAKDSQGNESTASHTAVAGIVASISGTSLTVTSNAREREASTTAVTFTVDASNATVTKNGATSTLGAVTVGDRVMVRGTVAGTQVVATSISDGKMLGRGKGPMMGKGSQGRTASSTRPMMTFPTGNGQPIIAGTVSSIQGTTLSVSTKAGITYSVDAASTTVMKSGVISTLSTIASGDAVVVQGAVTGTSVTASSIIDQGTVPAGSEGFEGAGKGAGFFHAMGGFFSRMFGFL